MSDPAEKRQGKIILPDGREIPVDIKHGENDEIIFTNAESTTDIAVSVPFKWVEY